MGNEIAYGAIVKPIACVQFLNTELAKSGVGLKEFKRRMGEVEIGRASCRERVSSPV